jgi:hypothetical protein
VTEADSDVRRTSLVADVLPNKPLTDLVAAEASA